MAALFVIHSGKGKNVTKFKTPFLTTILKEDLDEFFSPQFEILLLEAYEEMEEDDSILFNRKKINGNI